MVTDHPNQASATTFLAKIYFPARCRDTQIQGDHKLSPLVPEQSFMSTPTVGLEVSHLSSNVVLCILPSSSY